ncbi:MAG: hypothetical protein RIT14_1149 [Pseudomonadota bacterium]|jgi:copper(I)-binding protein
MAFRTLLAAVAAALTLAAPVAAQDHPEGLHIHDAYARSTGASGAVFFIIHNNTGADDRLLGASTDAAEVAELHSHSETADGVMQMAEIVGGVPLPMGEMHAFARGGDHVMLMGLTRKLADGDSLRLTLHFAVAGDITLEVPVDNARKPDEVDATPGSVMHHDHSAQDHD